MQINFDDSLYVSSVSALYAPTQINTSSNSTEDEDTSSSLSLGMDEYIPASAEAGFVPTGTYGKDGMMVGPPPIPRREMDAEMMNFDLETDTDSEGSSDLMSTLSNTFRANEDSILNTMEELGLTEEDLSDEENLRILANAMNEGAAALGLPQIEDLDAAIESILNANSTTEAAEAETAEAETTEAEVTTDTTVL